MDRVILVGVIGIALLFGLYKGVGFVASQIMSLLSISQASSDSVTPEHIYDGVVVLDPGHGGMDAGAKKGTLYEKNISLTTAQAIGKSLEKENIKVVYTRTTDKALHEDKATDLQLRADMSATNKANYYISIHVNDFDKSNDVSGFEVYTKDDKSRQLASSISTYIEKLNYSKNRGLQDGSGLAVLRGNTVPSVLVELGYINGKDYNYLNNDEKLGKIGEAIAQGIVEQLKNKN